jgi:hypothetical protein
MMLGRNKHAYNLMIESSFSLSLSVGFELRIYDPASGHRWGMKPYFC